jgi:molecular chaperone HtpG
VTADTYAAAKYSPHLEVFKKKGVEVLLLSDRVDEWMLSYLQEFDGKELQSCAKGGLDLGALEDEKDKETKKKVEDEFKDVLKKVEDLLKDRIKEARVTLRLTDSPACIVADEAGMSEHLKRMLKQAGQNAPDTKPILELNPEHPFIQRLKIEKDHFDEWVNVLFDQAVLAEGGQLEDPAGFVRRLNMLLLTVKA